MRTVWLDDREHKKNAKGAKMHCYMWVGMKLLSIQAVLTSIPKKRFSVWKRETIFPLAVSSQ